MKFTCFAFCILLMLACNRVKKKGAETISATREQAHRLKEEASDKVLRHFDDASADTKFNRRRFAEFFHFEPGPDVHGLYCMADEMGIDSKYAFAFSCSEATRNRIARELSLKQVDVPGETGEGIWPERPWWDTATIHKLKPFYKKSEHDLYQLLWYDSATHRAFYFDFDL